MTPPRDRRAVHKRLASPGLQQRPLSLADGEVTRAHGEWSATPRRRIGAQFGQSSHLNTNVVGIFQHADGRRRHDDVDFTSGACFPAFGTGRSLAGERGECGFDVRPERLGTMAEACGVNP